MNDFNHPAAGTTSLGTSRLIGLDVTRAIALIGVVVDAGTLDAIAGRTAGDVDAVADVSDHVPVVVRLDVGQLHALRADQADSALEARHLHVLQEAPRGLLGDHDATRVGSAAPADHMTAAVEGDRCDEA